MNDEFKNVLAILGDSATIVALGCLIIVAIYGISEKFEEMRYLHRIKHRFDKPPTAKCYCVDCDMHQENGCCEKFEGWITADNWFCWSATPRDANSDKQ